ncbi:Serine hydrolase-like protein [Tolypocladium ophioglossoides CBS 100239]|uniref:Serine hydrolase-like protein n=1 Tax=Tolypocladium ophioglossoides (strain CBS 100239) TaxID=1163406 RepID=A0A0L0NLS0_TOLOC|nr:Serine hydrolase-like protein [Tolypocladium ophioglossoides CBS 100239]
MDSAARSLAWPSAPVLVTATALATASLLALARAALWPRRAKVLRGPLQTALPQASPAALAALVYRPDEFPGARDVATPYGSVRVYEFGPEDGEKMLFVHGISTSCITLGRIARRLVERGCRVMLFDLFGRGFSDGVGDLPHDARLYTAQMLCVLASSPLAWTGSRAMRLVGYSLGGGIAVHFANAFPHLVSSLVLLAPAGLICPESFGAVTRFVFSSGIVPERILARGTGRRLQTPIAASRRSRGAAAAVVAVAAAASEAVDLRPAAAKPAPLEERVAEYVRWMVVHHDGFVPAFMSCIRFAPLTAQHPSWRQLAERRPGTTAVLLAQTDEIIDAEAYAREGLPLAGGEANVVWRVLPGSHDFVMTHVEPIMDELDRLWDMKKPS